MLAILLIKIEWRKESRNAKGAEQRKTFYSPVKIDNDIDLNGEGIFLKQCNYYQHDKKIYLRKNRGSFKDLEKINIPYINIVPEPNGSYKIKWFDCKHGLPYRRGGNEDVGNIGSKLYKQWNTLNETAFILHHNESGILKYNCRNIVCFEGIHYYEYYCVYIVNTNKLTHNMFIREYDYHYHQLAKLY